MRRAHIDSISYLARFQKIAEELQTTISPGLIEFKGRQEGKELVGCRCCTSTMKDSVEKRMLRVSLCCAFGGFHSIW